MKNILLIVVLAISLVFNFILLRYKGKIEESVKQYKQIIKKAEEDITQLKKDIKKLKDDNEKLKGDAVSYLEINSRLEKEKEEIAGERDKIQKELENLKREKDSYAEEDTGKDDKIKELVEMNNKLQDRINEKNQELLSWKDKFTKEKALFYYNLGVAYTKGGLYNEAEKAYKNSLTLQKNNPDAHYNLGLLYENAKNEPEKAIIHYEKYLELKPDAKDKEEVQEWIETLKTKIYR
jgi:tetratricopeptide (TPR) repeat protein